MFQYNSLDGVMRLIQSFPLSLWERVWVRVLPYRAIPSPSPSPLAGEREFLWDPIASFAGEQLTALDQLGRHCLPVTNDAELGNLKDRRLRVGVHSDDMFRARDARNVLGRAGDPEGQI